MTDPAMTAMMDQMEAELDNRVKHAVSLCVAAKALYLADEKDMAQAVLKLITSVVNGTPAGEVRAMFFFLAELMANKMLEELSDEEEVALLDASRKTGRECVKLLGNDQTGNR